MNGRCLRSNNNFSSIGEDPTECVVNMSIQQFVLGDIIWCKINGQSWWPGQVVDEKFVASKPKKRKKDQFLVRLYGTFEHMYVEPVNCVPKNEKINGQNNCTNREIFEKSLKEELSRMKSGGQSETKNSESNENAKEIDEALRGKGQGKGQRKGKLKRTNNEDNFPLFDSSDNPKAAKQIKMVIRGPRRKTRYEIFKGRNDEKKGMETAAETQKLNNGTSTINSLDKNDLRISVLDNDKEKLTSNLHYKAPDSNSELNLDAYKNAQIDISDPKYIKKLVAKIVKEVAAENDRNEALKIRVESYRESTEHIETSRKISNEIVSLKQHIQRKVVNQDKDLQITGVIDDTPDKTVPNDVGITNGADQVKILRERDFDSNNNEMAKDVVVDAFESMPIFEDQGTNCVRPDQSTISNVYLRKMLAVKCSETEMAINGDQRCKVVKDASRKQMDRAGTNKCHIPEKNGELSPRQARVMQNLGLIAPSGSPFRRNGLMIKPLLPEISQLPSPMSD